MNAPLSPVILLGAAYAFGLRFVEMSLDTLRILFVLRGRRSIAWGVGIVQSLLFLLAITAVLTNLDSILTILAYAAGFASGNVFGMFIEEKLAIGHIHLRIISSRRGAAIAERLRSSGFAVTEMSGRGKDGMVTLINSNVLRKHVPRVEMLVRELDEDAFITAEEILPIHRGFWHA